jgi:hypothetical protein
MPSWPNLFIAGAPRCGTSSLHAYLDAIPGVFMSRIKEPNYFSRCVIGEDHPMVRPIRDQDAYLALFAAAGDARIRGEASPNYLEDPEAPELIDRTVPGARVIASLRDPVERLFSHYLMMRNNRPMGSFAEEIERGLATDDGRSHGILDPRTGLYAAHVERYRAVFGPRFKILIFEEWMADVPATLRDVLQFLGVDQEIGEFSEPKQRQYAEARGPLVRYLFGNRAVSRAAEMLIPFGLRKRVRNALLVRPAAKPEMEPGTREFLVRYYRDDVERLESLLGRRLPWRNFGNASPTRSAG